MTDSKTDAGGVSPSDPLVIIAGIRKFGLAPDGSDLRDLEAALIRSTPVPCDGEAVAANISGASTGGAGEIPVRGLTDGDLAKGGSSILPSGTTPPARSDAPAYRMDIFEAAKRASAKCPATAPSDRWLQALMGEMLVEPRDGMVLRYDAAMVAENYYTTISEKKGMLRANAKAFGANIAEAIRAAPPHSDAGSERVAFQRWLPDHLMPSEFSSSYLFKADEDGNYAIDFVRDAWAAWQARAALTSPPPFGVREALEHVTRLERIAEIVRDETRLTSDGTIHNSTDVAKLILQLSATDEAGPVSTWTWGDRLSDLPDMLERAKMLSTRDSMVRQIDAALALVRGCSQPSANCGGAAK